MMAIGGALFASAQDSTASRTDTIRVGGMIIIKKSNGSGKDQDVVISSEKKKKSSNLTTNWGIIDLGFANVIDNTNISAAQASGFLGAGFGEDQLDYRTKSINVNIWFFMQRLNLAKRVVNLQYGLGLELNNYHFDDERVRINKNPTQFVLDPALVDIKKNKLAADYVTVPMMLNFNFTPKRKQGFGISAGISAGYLYSARQKFKDNDDKTKVKDDFNLEKWKLSYIGELALGPVKLYGSYAMNNMWERGLDQTPYNVGIRLSNW